MLSFASPTWPIVQPRDWQARAFPILSDAYSLEDVQGLVSAIMGSGKSVLIDELCATVKQGKNETIIVSTSSQMLTEDLHESISRRCQNEKRVGIFYANEKRLGDIVVCCNDSLSKLASKLSELGRQSLFWIADEVHKSEAGEMLEGIKKLRPQNRLGLTATAFRSCPKETISLFRKLIFRYTVAEAVRDKVVVPWLIVHWNGDESELDDACLSMIREAKGPGLANAATIGDAEQFAEKLRGIDIPSAAIHSKLDRGTRKKIIEQLKAGVLRCVVHVNILSEGANFPWLRWLCMRRQVGARVRFIQEIGRLLRSYEGKEEAIFYDPHDLFGSFNLTYKEALGEASEDEQEEKEITPKAIASRLAEHDPALSIGLVESVIRGLVVACDTGGILKARRPIKKTERLAPSTRMQHIEIKRQVKLLDKIIPEDWRILIYEIEKNPVVIRFGFCADLLLALYSVRNFGRWPSVTSEGRISGLPEEKEAKEIPLILEKTGQYRYI